MRVKKAFLWKRTFACIPDAVPIPAGVVVDWHNRNKCYYVRPQFFINDGIVLHDATYYGCRVAPDNVE
jgi:hypothetical protein